MTTTTTTTTQTQTEDIPLADMSHLSEVSLKDCFLTLYLSTIVGERHATRSGEQTFAK